MQLWEKHDVKLGAAGAEAVCSIGVEHVSLLSKRWQSAALFSLSAGKMRGCSPKGWANPRQRKLRVWKKFYCQTYFEAESHSILTLWDIASSSKMLADWKVDSVYMKRLPACSFSGPLVSFSAGWRENCPMDFHEIWVKRAEMTCRFKKCQYFNLKTYAKARQAK